METILLAAQVNCEPVWPPKPFWLIFPALFTLFPIVCTFNAIYYRKVLWLALSLLTISACVANTVFLVQALHKPLDEEIHRLYDLSFKSYIWGTMVVMTYGAFAVDGGKRPANWQLF